jgi:four helix bundle protein
VETKKSSSYKDLIAWQKSIKLVTTIYSVTKSFPAEEKFGIISQLNRAAVSVPSNIAEGWGRESSKSYLQFLRTSRGSLMELETLLLISKNLNYISESTHKDTIAQLEETGKILQGLIKSVQQKIKLTQADLV